jgi:peptide/nickel transport system permease protein
LTTQEKHSELISSGVGLAGAIALESGDQLGEQIDVKARGYWEQVWRRFRRDRVAVGSIFFIVFLVLLCFPGAWLAQKFLGHGPDDLFFDGVDDRLIPLGPWSYVTNPESGERQLFILGSDSALGRDEFLRLLYGGRVSLQVAVTEVTMAFPALLFIIALASTVGSRLDNVTFGIFGRGVVTLVFVFVMLGWFYPARIIRAQVLSLREKEFIEAARMVGASDWRIIRSHLLPHLMAPIIVFSTLIVAGYILGEAGLSFLGLGIKLPTASWGNLLSSAPEYYTLQPWLMVWPGLAVLVTTLAFNLLGDGLRDAFDPRSTL